MKIGWQTKKVADIARHSLGKMLDKAKNKGEPKPYLRNLNVRWFEFDLSDMLEMRFLPEETNRYSAVKGDVLICEGGYPGRAAIWQHDEPIFFQKALHRVRFREPERNKWFLYYLFMKDLDGTLKNHFNGAGIQHFTGEALAEFEVPLPPLPEQRHIVGILDEAFAGIATAKANAEKNLQNARALFESHLQSVFAQRGNGWVEKRLVDASREFGRGKSKHRPRNEPGLYNGPYPFIQTGDISNADHWLTDYTQTYSERGLAQSRLWPKGTICIAIVGATVGETAILDFDACFPDSVIGFVVNDQVADGEYVEFLLQAFKALLKEKGKGTARDNINLGTFENQKFPFPALKRQKEIVSTLNALGEETQRLAHFYERKLAALEALKKSLLHQAFTGQL